MIQTPANKGNRLPRPAPPRMTGLALTGLVKHPQRINASFRVFLSA
jgi:hypothetical protein